MIISKTISKILVGGVMLIGSMLVAVISGEVLATEFQDQFQDQLQEQLVEAIEQTDPDQVQVIINKGADVRVLYTNDTMQCGPLFFAIAQSTQGPKALELVKILLDTGASTQGCVHYNDVTFMGAQEWAQYFIDAFEERQRRLENAKNNSEEDVLFELRGPSKEELESWIATARQIKDFIENYAASQTVRVE